MYLPSFQNANAVNGGRVYFSFVNSTRHNKVLVKTNLINPVNGKCKKLFQEMFNEEEQALNKPLQVTESNNKFKGI